MSIDGYIAGPNGEMDWMVWNWDDKLKNYVSELTEPVDTIILGRKMTDGFVSYWSDVMTKPDYPSYAFAKKMMETPKVVFTKTLKKSQWENTDIARGDSKVYLISYVAEPPKFVKYLPQVTHMLTSLRISQTP